VRIIIAATAARAMGIDDPEHLRAVAQRCGVSASAVRYAFDDERCTIECSPEMAQCLADVLHQRALSSSARDTIAFAAAVRALLRAATNATSGGE
jgi:hypothetical protein